MAKFTPPLSAAIIGSLSAFFLSGAHATVIDYTALGTFTTASLNAGGVLVSGSNTINVLNLNGLGIVGGAFNDTVDGSEYVDFSFSGMGSAVNLSYLVTSAGNLNGDGLVGDRFLSVYGVGGGLLGTFSQNSGGSFNVSGLVANAPIDHIRLQANVDNFRLGSITFTAQAVSTVPEPATLALVAAAMGVGTLLRRRPRSR